MTNPMTNPTTNSMQNSMPSSYFLASVFISFSLAMLGVCISTRLIPVPKVLQWIPTEVSPIFLVVTAMVLLALVFLNVDNRQYRLGAAFFSILALVISSFLLMHAYGFSPIDLDSLLSNLLPGSIVAHTKAIVTGCLLFISLSTLILCGRTRKHTNAAQLALLPVLFCVFLAFNATLFNVNAFAFGGQSMILSILEALSLTYIMIVIVGARSDEGLMELLSDYSVPGEVFRRLLFLGVLVPVVFGVASHGGQRLFGYSSMNAAALMTSGTILFIGACWIWGAGKLSRLDMEHRSCRKQMSLINSGLEEHIAELERLNEELAQTSRESALAHDQALEASRQKAQFFSNMSHEIRTPMNGVLGMVEIVLRSELEPQVREYALMIKEQGQSLLSVLNDILDFSKIETGKLSLELTDFEPVKLIEDVADLASEEASKREVSLMAYVDPQIPGALEGDSSRIRQILTNLTQRAINRIGVSQILIQCSLVSDEGSHSLIRFSVVDDGQEITDDEQNQLREAKDELDQLTPSTPLSAGVLGLSLAQRLVDLMGSEIIWASEEGGTIFSFDLRCRRSLEKITRSVNTQLDGLKVLVVDDDSSSRQILESYLSAWRMRCKTAPDGISALGTLRTAIDENDPFKLAIIDMRMPTLTGLELGESIKADEHLKDLCMILVTAYDDPQLGNEAIARGFSAFFTKPIRQSQLFDCIISTVSEATGIEIPGTSSTGDISSGIFAKVKVSERKTVLEYEPEPPPARLSEEDTSAEDMPIARFSPAKGKFKSKKRTNSDDQAEPNPEKPVPLESDQSASSEIKQKQEQKLEQIQEQVQESKQDLEPELEPVLEPELEPDLEPEHTDNLSELIMPVARFSLKKSKSESKDAAEIPAIASPSLVPSVPSVPSNRALVTDDNSINQRVAKILLEDEGFDVVLAGDGRQALEIFTESLARGEAFSMIFMDCQMPVMDGFESAGAIRKLERERRISRTPILALTADTMDDTRKKCLDAGMDDYILKPIDPERLRLSIEKWKEQGVNNSVSLENVKESRQESRQDQIIESSDIGDDELINLSNLKERFSSDDIKMLFMIAIDSLEEESAKLSAAIESGDDTTIARAAHAFKGASMSLEATSLYTLLRRLELAGKAGEKDSYQPLYLEIEKIYPLTVAEIKKLRESI